MAPAGAIAHSRAHLCPRAVSLSFSSLVSPLRPSGLGLLGRCDPRSSPLFFSSLRTQVRQAIEFVSGKEGLRPRIAVFVCGVPWYAVAPWLWGTCFLRVHGQDHLGLYKRQGRWQWRSLRPLALLSFVARFAPLRCTSDAVTWSLCSDSPLSSRPQPLGGVGDETPCEETREDFGLSF